MSQPKEPKYWIGNPDPCDFCDTPMTKNFVDGKTKEGPWAFMCQTCFRKHGVGLGPGKGQKYEKQTDDRWLKIGG